ncbi:hypothetical protein E0L93_03210 [Rubrobacter taiwanensis]|uniref:D-glucuronyl C5-epimerase C-terminal domain-containing protein n=1 Tax=Rubrobacter taiwanensis TaxID=185139 RepID=A0A4R1BQT0_9ACTN|nr:hypothetical protein [Rubrobacter taiwanensis]TCJ19971.1 hypothetical protein E0L93_03210 [Rubrobacter taiwanensis]
MVRCLWGREGDRKTWRGVALLWFAVVPIFVLGSGASGAQSGERLTNLSHLDFLRDSVDPPEQEGHTTYRIQEEPEIGVLWTYAEPDELGEYRRIGGGSYDPETNTYSQGAYNTDDMTRAAIVYIRHWQQTGSEESREAAYELLRGVAYMQTLSPAERRGNFVLWMQPDGTLNPSAEPKELPDPSDSGPSYWLARGIWAFGEGYEAFEEEDPGFAAFLKDRMRLALDALERQVLVNYGETRMLDGREVPAWLIFDGADASSEAVYGLAAYVRATGDARARRDLEMLAEGIALMREEGSPGEWPFGAILPWAQSRSVWHGWGDQMSGALFRAGAILGDEKLVATAVGEVGTFTPHLLVQGGADQGWLPAPVDRAQIAYGADATLQNLLAAAETTGKDSFRQLAGIAAGWYFGNNRAGVRMYDPKTGRTFDGLEADGRINRNSGAESTIHGLLSMLALDANPDVREQALGGERREQVTWRLVEAEAGRLKGQARVVTPEEPWTGESLWSGGAYVELAPGGSVTVEAELPARDRYRVLPVFDRLKAPPRAAGTRHKLGAVPAGVVWHGGAGEQGISAREGYLDIGNTGSGKTVGPGTVEVLSAHVGSRPARLDALLLQPEVERLVLVGEERVQALLRSWSGERRIERLDLGSCGPVTAYAYDAQGGLVETAVGTGGTADAPVVPGGFTYVVCKAIEKKRSK